MSHGFFHLDLWVFCFHTDSSWSREGFDSDSFLSRGCFWFFTAVCIFSFECLNVQLTLLILCVSFSLSGNETDFIKVRKLDSVEAF